MTRRLCLVTGASAGIGAAFARIYASHGFDVALTARRADRLEQLSDEIKLRFGVETLVLPADLSRPETPAALAAEIEAQGRQVDVLVNNAGYGLPGAYAHTGWSDQAALLQVLLMSVCDLTHRLLPGMIERGYGRVVNVASLAGLVPGMPSHTLYGPAKAFLVKFSQALHVETLGSGVHVSALCPGFTYSEFHDVNGTRAETGRLPSWMWLGADEVAAAGYEAAEANRPVCVTGAPNKAIAAICKIVPDEWVLAFASRNAGRIRRM
jgi:short-subunit dehydrogenase